MRAVIDTSVLVSGLISPRGAPAQVLARWLEGRFTLLYSPSVYAEYEDVLHRTWLHERFAGLSNPVEPYLEATRTFGQLVTGHVDVAGAVRDPFDEAFLACALLGQAHYLVTVDRDLLVLGAFAGTRTVTPAQFLAETSHRDTESPSRE